MPVRAKFIMLLLLASVCVRPAFALNSITVMADSSMNVVMAELARDYSGRRQAVVNMSFAAMQAQNAQISEGAAADILITPQQAWVEELKGKGLVDMHSPTVVAANQLVLVGPVDSTLDINLAKHFPVSPLIKQMGGQPLFLVGNPGTQIAGIYGKEALRNFGVSDELEPYTVYIKDTDPMFEMVKKQHAYGIFLSSAVVRRDDVQLLDTFPKTSHRPIAYYAVAIAGDNMDEARKFLLYLKSAEAKAIFKRNGFTTD